MGECGQLRASGQVVTREQAQLVRLLLICLAWSIGQVLTTGLSLGPANVIVPAVLGVGVYALSDDLGRSEGGGGDAKYWRGRRIDDDRRGGGRLN